MDLDLKYRPRQLKNVIGQEVAVKIVRGLLKNGLPHKLMFCGPSGCGKTTLARIVAKKIKCDLDCDFDEVNCADARGVDTIRDIRRVMGLAPMAGECRVYLLDEAHKLTNDAQTAMLKMIEEPPGHVYFILATTEPDKLIQTVLTRVTRIPVQSVDDDLIHQHLVNVNTAEGEPVTNPDVLEKVVELAGGSVRSAVKLFESVKGIEEADAQIQALERQDSKRQAVEIARALCNPRARWADLANILRLVEDDPEKIRHMILGYFSTILLAGGKLAPRAAELIELFRDNWYDSKKAGLYASVYAACRQK